MIDFPDVPKVKLDGILWSDKNPVAIIVPCHRVIAADGTLGGYGGGLDRKCFLLALEGAKLNSPAQRLF